MHKRAPLPLLLDFCLLLASLFCWCPCCMVPMECTLAPAGIMGSNPTCSYTEICRNLTRLAAEEMQRWQSDKATWVLTTAGIRSLPQGGRHASHPRRSHLPRRQSQAQRCIKSLTVHQRIPLYPRKITLIPRFCPHVAWKTAVRVTGSSKVPLPGQYFFWYYLVTHKNRNEHRADQYEQFFQMTWGCISRYDFLLASNIKMQQFFAFL